MMIGRQNYTMLTPTEFHVQLLRGGIDLTKEEAESLYNERAGFVEPLITLLGAEKIESIDYSAYEKATIIHDLNQPIAEHLKNAFSCVLDGGALEHVFNFPQAVKNCMEMVSVGGHFLGVTAGNNFLGHGFYQFSPELYYRVFSQENGYKVQEMFVCETDPGAQWYRVADPETLKSRVELVNSRPTYMMVSARKLRCADIFRTPPQQSDYVATWSNQAGTQPDRQIPNAGSAVTRRIKGAVPEPIKAALRPMLGTRKLSWFDSKPFSRVVD
jgi:hypothetical protein